MGCASSASRARTARERRGADGDDGRADARAMTGVDARDELRIDDDDDVSEVTGGARDDENVEDDDDGDEKADDEDDDDDGDVCSEVLSTPNARETAPVLTMSMTSASFAASTEAFEPTPRSRLTVTPSSSTAVARLARCEDDALDVVSSRSEDDELHARLRAMERAVDALGDKARDADCVEIAYHEMREAYDALRRDARAFCAECGLEAEAAMGTAQRAVQDARRALKQQASQFDGVVDDMERDFRHKVATATLKSKSEAARAKLRAGEALEECEKYRHEVLRLQTELQRASDALAISNVERHPPSTSKSERECVLDAEHCLEAFAEQQLQLELAKREQRSATLALAEMNSLLIESRDEVYDLKSAKHRV